MVKQVLMTWGIVLLQVIFLNSASLATRDNNLNTFLALKSNHIIKSLTSEKTNRVVQLSDENRFKAYLNPILIERVSGSEGNKKVQKHITDSLEALGGWHIEKDTFENDTPHGPKTFTNIIATQNPEAPRKLVLACHFDSKYFKTFSFIGMTDSAVPCAMMLDLAASLKNLFAASSPSKASDVTLQLMFFDGEEAFVQWTGLDNTYGSRHLAEKMAEQDVMVDREVTVKAIDTIDVLVLLDLIGARDTRFVNYFDNTQHLFQRLQRIEQRLGKAKQLQGVSGSNNLYFKSQRGHPGGIEDDHIPFLRRGVPIVHLISSPFPTVWHRESDNKKAIDYGLIADLNKVFRVFVVEYLRLKP